MPEKNTHFSWFREFSPAFDKIPFFLKIGTSMDVRFGREGGGDKICLLYAMSRTTISTT